MEMNLKKKSRLAKSSQEDHVASESTAEGFHGPPPCVPPMELVMSIRSHIFAAPLAARDAANTIPAEPVKLGMAMSFSGWFQLD